MNRLKYLFGLLFKYWYKKQPEDSNSVVMLDQNVESKAVIIKISDKRELKVEEDNSVKWSMNNVCFKKIFNTFGEPDINFQSGSRSFKVHKKVLEKHSSVIKAKLSDVWRTSGDVLQLDEEYVEPEVVEELLVWMYYMATGTKRKCSTENAYSLCMAARYLLISELVTICCRELRREVTPDNIHDIYTLSNHLNLDSLRQICEWSITDMPTIFFLSPKIVKCNPEDLKILIEKSLKVEKSSKVCETILFSLIIWTEASFEDRFRELENLLKLIPPEVLSSDALFGFMETEFYSKLDELHRKQYYVRSYLPTGVSSTDKLYCLTRVNSYGDVKVKLDIEKWSFSQQKQLISFQPNRFGEEVITDTLAFGVSYGEKIYFFVQQPHGTAKDKKCRFIKVFNTDTDEWISSKVAKERIDDNRHILAGAALDGHIYITESTKSMVAGKSLKRFCLETNQWNACKEMQTNRQKHQLVALDGLLYAISGEIHGLGPERYDPRANCWNYIAPSNYRHELPSAVAHEGQIYVLSQAGFEQYSPETDQWTRLPAPDVRRWPLLVSITGRLWLMTDSVDFSNWTLKLSRRVYEFDVVKQEWTRLADLPGSSYTDSAFVIKQ